jgi:hypothetical protein
VARRILAGKTTGFQRAIMAGQWAWRTTEVETLPRRVRFSPPEALATEDNQAYAKLLGQHYYGPVRPLVHLEVGLCDGRSRVLDSFDQFIENPPGLLPLLFNHLFEAGGVVRHLVQG